MEMKCPKCGFGRARYKVQRKQYHKGSHHASVEERQNWDAECPKCGYTWTEEPQPVVKLGGEERVEPIKAVGYYILCTKKNQNMIKDAFCDEFEPIHQGEKKRCWNCKHHKVI